MSARLTYTIGRTTAESSSSYQLKRFKPRVLADEESKTSAIVNPAQESLVSKCMKVIIQNFERMPVKEVLSPLQMAEIACQLQTTLSPLVGAKYVFNENYWRKCCVEKYGWHGCKLSEHGLLWKQLFFEKLLTERLEDFNIEIDNETSLYTLVQACSEYIFTVSFRQLRSHIDILGLLLMLPNLTKLDLTYSVKKIGMNYDRALFGMKMRDATALGEVFSRVYSLTTIMLVGNMLDDVLLGVLMSGLMDNNTVTNLDLSHNKISNHGANLLSKYLRTNKLLTSLNVADNKIGTEGGRYLAEGLREKNSLLHLNIKLNCLSDDGCHMLLEGLLENDTLIELDIGSNMAGTKVCLTVEFYSYKTIYLHAKQLILSYN
jgi:Leucine Rich repeat